MHEDRTVVTIRVAKSGTVFHSSFTTKERYQQQLLVEVKEELEQLHDHQLKQRYQQKKYQELSQKQFKQCRQASKGLIGGVLAHSRGNSPINISSGKSIITVNKKFVRENSFKMMGRKVTKVKTNVHARHNEGNLYDDVGNTSYDNDDEEVHNVDNNTAHFNNNSRSNTTNEAGTSRSFQNRTSMTMSRSIGGPRQGGRTAGYSKQPTMDDHTGQAEGGPESPDFGLTRTDSQFFRPHQRRKRCVTAGMIVLALTGIIVGVTIGLTGNASDDNNVGLDIDTASTTGIVDEINNSTNAPEETTSEETTSEETIPPKPDLPTQRPTDNGNEMDDYIYIDDLNNTTNMTYSTDFPTSSPTILQSLPVESFSSIWLENDIGTLCHPTNLETPEGQAACNSMCVDIGYQPCCNRDLEDSCFSRNKRTCSKTAGCMVLQGKIVPPPLSALSVYCKQPVSLFPQPKSAECVEACDAASCCFIDPIEEESGGIFGGIFGGLLGGRRDDDDAQNSTLEVGSESDDDNALGQSCRLTDELACEQYESCVNNRYDPSGVPGPLADLSTICYSEDAQDIAACAEACSVATCCTDSAELGYIGFGKGDCFSESRLSCLAHAPCMSLHENGIVSTAPGNLADLCSQSTAGDDNDIDVSRECEIACGKGACCTSNDIDFNCVSDSIDKCRPYIEHCSMVNVFENIPPPPTDLETVCAPQAIASNPEIYFKCKRSCAKATCCDTPNLSGIVSALMSGNSSIVRPILPDFGLPDRDDDDGDFTSGGGEENPPVSTMDDLYGGLASDDMKMRQLDDDKDVDISIEGIRNSCALENIVGCSFYLPCVSLQLVDPPVDALGPQQPIVDQNSNSTEQRPSFNVEEIPFFGPTIPNADPSIVDICTFQNINFTPDGASDCARLCEPADCCNNQGNILDGSEESNPIIDESESETENKGCFLSNMEACRSYSSCAILSQTDSVTSIPVASDNITTICSRQYMRGNGAQDCLNMCEPAQCCFIDNSEDAYCYDDNLASCISYRDCTRLEDSVLPTTPTTATPTLMPTTSTPTTSTPTTIPTTKPTRRGQANNNREPTTSIPTTTSPTVTPTLMPTTSTPTTKPTRRGQANTNREPTTTLPTALLRTSAPSTAMPTKSPTFKPTRRWQENDVIVPIADVVQAEDVCSFRAIRKDPADCQAFCEPSKCCVASGRDNCYRDDNSEACMSYKEYCFSMANLNNKEENTDVDEGGT